jgi:MFS transporter
VAPLQGPSPFARLSMVHAVSICGDTLVTTALAGSLFFSISPGAARSRVALYLALTMAPFAVVAPLLGPALDRSRGGRRLVVVASQLGRAVLCLAMARHLHSLLLFPEAFGVLVLSKAYAITKSALVPAAVADETGLVQANSRLAVLAVLAGFVSAGPGILVLKIGFLGAPWVLRLAAVVFLAATVAAVRLVRTPIARSPVRVPAEREELRAAGIVLAASGMAVLRGVVGFLTFLLAFSFRRAHAPSWWFGLAIAASMGGTFVGAALAPRVRRAVSEERILTASLLVVVVGGLLGAWFGSRGAASAMAGAVGLAAGAGKLAFDSIVQRDAPDAARGRTFARFETQFQLAWVVGAIIPVVAPIPRRLGLALIAGGAAFAAFSYIGGRRATVSRR